MRSKKQYCPYERVYHQIRSTKIWIAIVKGQYTSWLGIPICESLETYLVATAYHVHNHNAGTQMLIVYSFNGDTMSIRVKGFVTMSRQWHA
jgi:hypothetical protein